MYRGRQQSSTLYPIPMLMVSSGDHVTGLTGKTVSVTLSKNCAAFAAAAGAVTEIGSGWYSLAANATDRNTVGELVIRATASGCDPFEVTYGITSWDPFTLPVSVSPLAASVAAALAPTDVQVQQKSNSPSVAWTVVDATGAAINLTGATVRLKVYDQRTKVVRFTKATGGSGIVISGASSNVATATFAAADVAVEEVLAYTLYRDDATVQVLAAGMFEVVETAIP